MKVVKYNDNNIKQALLKLEEEKKVLEENKKQVIKTLFEQSDDYGTSIFSQSLQEGKLDLIRIIYGDGLNDVELLKEVANQLNNSETRNNYDITLEAAQRAYGEINHQFHLMGEDTSGLADNCTLFNE